jgi:hypothetical protein
VAGNRRRTRPQAGSCYGTIARSSWKNLTWLMFAG